MNWIQEFQYRIRCYCPCHIDDENVFSFTKGIHCDRCYDKSIKKKDVKNMRFIVNKLDKLEGIKK